MTLEPSLHKERVDFSHNYTPFRIKCPACMKIVKGANHVEVHKNLPAGWRHFKTEHYGIVTSQFDFEMIKDIYRSIGRAIEFKMLPDLKVEEQTTTSLSILYDGRKPRSDVYSNLVKIARVMKCQSSLYPSFRVDNIFAYIKVILGNPDMRTKKKYIECIINHSHANRQDGTFDVTDFCNKLIN